MGQENWRAAEGTKNKRPGVHAETRSIREAFKYAFDQLGGGEALAAWGRANPASSTGFARA